jgi:hypothetical protein
VATAHDAAEHISMLVVNGSPNMQEAEDNFRSIYRNPLSAPDVLLPVPNQAMKGFRPRYAEEDDA